MALCIINAHSWPQVQCSFANEKPVNAHGHCWVKFLGSVNPIVIIIIITMIISVPASSTSGGAIA